MVSAPKQLANLWRGFFVEQILGLRKKEDKGENRDRERKVTGFQSQLNSSQNSSGNLAND